MKRLETRKSSVKWRVERRLEVLLEWRKTGVPTGFNLPESLTEAREWSVPALGIQRIASPNDFTKTHPEFGSLVGRIADVLNDLKTKYNHTASGKRRRALFERELIDQVEELKQRLAEAEDQLRLVTGQWQSADEAICVEKKRADAAASQEAFLRSDLEEKKAEIALLRRELSTRNGLRSVK